MSCKYIATVLLQLGAETNKNKWNNWWDDLYNTTAGKIQSTERSSSNPAQDNDCNSSNGGAHPQLGTSAKPKSHSSRKSRCLIQNLSESSSSSSSDESCRKQKNGTLIAENCESHWRTSCRKSNRQMGKLERIKVRDTK